MREPLSYDLAIFDSALADVVYTPEEIAFFERVLSDVCNDVAPHIVVTEGIRTQLAAAILEGASLGWRDHDRLSRFARKAIPVLRGSSSESFAKAAR